MSTKGLDHKWGQKSLGSMYYIKLPKTNTQMKSLTFGKADGASCQLTSWQTSMHKYCTWQRQWLCDPEYTCNEKNYEEEHELKLGKWGQLSTKEGKSWHLQGDALHYLPSFWLKILSKVTSPIFSKCLCITLLTLKERNVGWIIRHLSWQEYSQGNWPAQATTIHGI